MPETNLNQASNRELLTLFAQVLEHLRERGVVRSSNNPVADYCESLVARALSLTKLQKSSTGCDAVDSDGKRYEVKGRRITKHNPSTQLSVIRGLEACHFDYLVGVLFDKEFTVTRACCVPHEVVRNAAVYRQHVNGWIMLLRPALWDHPEVRDITPELKLAQKDWV